MTLEDKISMYRSKHGNGQQNPNDYIEAIGRVHMEIIMDTALSKKKRVVFTKTESGHEIQYK